MIKLFDPFKYLEDLSYYEEADALGAWVIQI